MEIQGYVCVHVYVATREDFLLVSPLMPAVFPACLGAALILKAHLNAHHTPDKKLVPWNSEQTASRFQRDKGRTPAWT